MSQNIYFIAFVPILIRENIMSFYHFACLFLEPLWRPVVAKTYDLFLII